MKEFLVTVGITILWATAAIAADSKGSDAPVQLSKSDIAGKKFSFGMYR